MSYLGDLEKKYMAACAEIAELTERVRQLEAGLASTGGQHSVPLEFHLTGRETKILQALMSRIEVTKEALMMEVYGDRYHEDDLPEIKIVDVFVCKIRKKLRPFKIDIETRWGRGYALPPESKALINAMLKKSLEHALGIVSAPSRRTA